MLHAEEAKFPFTVIAKGLPKRTGLPRPSVSTIWRWHIKGCHGVYLEALRLGGRLVTSFEAVERFSTKLAEKRRDELEASAPRREQAIERATRQLEDSGA